MPARFVTAKLPSGLEVQLLASVDGGSPSRPGPSPVGAQEFFSGSIPFTLLTEGLAEIGQLITGAIQRVKPSRAEVELALSIDAKTGKLSALFVEGGGEATMRVLLEWKSTK